MHAHARTCTHTQETLTVIREIRKIIRSTKRGGKQMKNWWGNSTSTGPAGGGAVPEQLADVRPCKQGPYVVDIGRHMEGLGSHLLRHKTSLIIAAALNASVLLQHPIVNSHDGKDYTRYLGLGANDCDYDSWVAHRERVSSDLSGDLRTVDMTLMTLPLTRDDSYRNITQTFQLRSLCVAIEADASPLQHSFMQPVLAGPDLQRLAVVTGLGVKQPDLNYCTFSALRGRWRVARTSRQVARKPASESWLVIHFRWGDRRVKDVNEVLPRKGVPLSQLMDAASAVLQSGALPGRVLIYMGATYYQ